MIKHADILQEYLRIMRAENTYGSRLWSIPDAEEMHGTALQIGEFAKANTVLRSYSGFYNMTDDSVAYESDGAHTNLMCALVDRALSYLYGPDFEHTSDGYTYREVMEAVRRHDLPENVIGDIPDNASRDEAAKTRAEHKYYATFKQWSPPREVYFDSKVRRLLYEMEQQSLETGRLLYAADKTASIIITLCYDGLGLSPIRFMDDPTASDRDRVEMSICNLSRDGGYFASEMWSVDYFKLRELINFDDTGYFTALIVMYTLLIHGCWYAWREAEYQT